MKKVRITVMRRACYRDLIEAYENPLENACDMEEGAVFVAEGWRRPAGFCESAWESLSPFVLGLAHGAAGFYGGWMQNPRSAMISCNDGFRPVSFLLEAVDEEAAENADEREGRRCDMTKRRLIWYPRCTTCKKAKAWLDAHGIEAAARDIQAEHPGEAELRAWRAASGLPLKRFFNTSGLKYKALGLKDKLPAMSEDEQYALLASDGMLVRRPILTDGDTVLVGFREAEWQERLL